MRSTISALFLFLLFLPNLCLSQSHNHALDRDSLSGLDSLLIDVLPQHNQSSNDASLPINLDSSCTVDSLRMVHLQDSIALLSRSNDSLQKVLVVDFATLNLLKDSLLVMQSNLLESNDLILTTEHSFRSCRDSLENLSFSVDSLTQMVTQLQNKTQLLQPLNKELNERIENLQAIVVEQGDMLNEQIQKIKEKEQLFAEKEFIYERAIQSSKIDLVKLEGQLQSKNSELTGKEREIELLAESISDGKQSITEKNLEIAGIRNRRESAVEQLDTLKDYLHRTEKDLILTKERLVYSKKEVKQLQTQLHDLRNKKKNIRLVQGMGIRNFRSPLYTLSPESSDNPNEYVITNENAGDYEFDFVTGATFRIVDIGKKNGRFTSDIGFFLGFGGKNLFKNFYLGPNIKIFDVIHINAGVNIAEFRLLKSGFSEGDRVVQGSSIPTVSKWELTPYLGLTFDFALITSIAAKL